jgi:outer membrane murein-binding lipoprotein Lpp
MKLILMTMVLASMLVIGCGGGGKAPSNPQTLEEHKAELKTQTEVMAVYKAAAKNAGAACTPGGG